MSFQIINDCFLNRYIEEPDETDVIIPEGIEVIGKQAFFVSGNMKSVTFPSTLKYVQPHAFECCYHLKEIRASHSVYYLWENVFYNCFPMDTLVWKGVTIPVDLLKHSLSRLLETLEHHMLHYLIEENLTESMQQALDSGRFVNQKNIDQLIRYANHHQKYEMQIILTRYKHDHLGYQNIFDKLKL